MESHPSGFDAVGWTTGGHLVCKSFATTIPKSLLLETKYDDV